jgi:hypothetical protein
MEKERVFCDPQSIDDFYTYLESRIDEIPAALVYNLDESGFQEWADARMTTVFVSAYYDRDEIEVPFDRSQRRATMLGCIRADGRNEFLRIKKEIFIV